MDEESNKKLRISTIVAWLFACFFLFLGLSSAFFKGIISPILFALVFFLLLPPTRKFIEEKIKYKFPVAVLILVAIIGLVIGLYTWPDITEEPEINEEVITDQVKENTNTTIQGEGEKEGKEKQCYEVSKIIDGDTIYVIIDGDEEKVRLIGIDAPETNHPTEPVQCFGQEATDKLTELLEGKKVYLEKDDTQANRDKYARLLRYAFLEDGTNISQYMISEGFAYEYTYDVPYKYQEDFKRIQEQAKEDKRGLWADDTCSGSTEMPQTATQEAPQEQEAPTTETAAPEPQSSSGVVKKSTTGICHAPGTTYYDRTKNFTPYNTLEECLNSGGRLPKN